ncbi:MAG: adenylate/guanylate cyclase domain-containing protein [Synechococcales cyanobacterium CRU_2_2]|nr:adenylate/guanylate cyclase domain-containing protein [Synechococcales cyanobacterium CRU_2_2]
MSLLSIPFLTTQFLIASPIRLSPGLQVIAILATALFIYLLLDRIDRERWQKRGIDEPVVPLAIHQSLLRALEQEQEKSEQLLLNILPASIAHRLKAKPRPIANGYDSVTVMFADIVGFTPLSARMAPKRLVCLLNLIFSAFDQLTERYQLEKIKTIGDAYMVAGGLPDTHPNHAEAMVELALEMQTAIAQISDMTGEDLRLRIGMHTGPVVAGVIGIKKFSYDLWGDTVNLASRMESSGSDGGIQISQSTYQLLPNHYQTRSLGEVQVKGRAGGIQAYEIRTPQRPQRVPQPSLEMRIKSLP